MSGEVVWWSLRFITSLGSKIFNLELPAKSEGKTYEDSEVTGLVIMVGQLITADMAPSCTPSLSSALWTYARCSLNGWFIAFSKVVYVLLSVGWTSEKQLSRNICPFLN